MADTTPETNGSLKMKMLKNLFSQKSVNFEAGDKVSAFGNIGTVKRISPNGLFVEVTFPEFDSVVTFHLDGKQTSWHKLPSLRKV